MPAQGDFIRLVRQRLDGTSSETLAQIVRLGRKRVDLLLPGGIKAQITRADLEGLEAVEPTDTERASMIK